MNRWIAALLALLVAAPAIADQNVRPYLLNPATGQSQQQTGQPTGAENNYIVNPSAGVAFVQGFAMGPVSLRENVSGFSSGSGTGLTPHWGDSTIVIPTNGAKRIEVWVYMIHDTASVLFKDSSQVEVMAILPKAHLIAAASDSGNSAYWQPMRSGGVGSLADSVWGRRVIGDFGSLYTSFNTARANSGNPASTPATPGFPGLLPGEIVVPYTRNFSSNSGAGIPPWTVFSLCVADNCFSSELISLRFRLLGHASAWPQAGLIAITDQRFAVRVDVKGYYQ